MKRKINIKHCIIAGLVLLSLILLIATPEFNRIENLHRVKEGLGGECLVWLFPYGLIGVIGK